MKQWTDETLDAARAHMMPYNYCAYVPDILAEISSAQAAIMRGQYVHGLAANQ